MHATTPTAMGMVSGDHKALAHKSIVAFLWGAGGSIARIFLQLGAQVALARILGPEVYGLFALGVLIVGVSTYFADFGLAYGLIQKQDMSDADVGFVWTWQCILGCLVALCVWAGAGQLAAAFGKPEVEPVFTWLSLACLINALSAASTNLLKKALDYKTLQLAQLASYVFGYIAIGIPLAMAGAGVFALVVAMLAQSALSLAMLYFRVRHPLALRFRTPGGRAMLAYGGTVLATNLINWVFTSADKILVGRMFPAHVVGLYNNAFNLVNSPAAAAYGTLQSVVFSACARLQNDPAALRGVFLRLVAAVTLAAFPLFAVLGVGADIAMAAIYGPAWVEATPYLRIFAFVMPCLLVWGISTPILWNSGRTTLEFQLQVPMAIVWCAVLWAVARQPGTTVALAAAGLLAARAFGMAMVAARILKLPAREVLCAMGGGAALTLLMAVTSLYALAPMARMPGNSQVQLLLLVVSSGLLFVAAMVILGPWLIDRPLALSLQAGAARLPRMLAPILRTAARTRT